MIKIFGYRIFTSGYKKGTCVYKMLFLNLMTQVSLGYLEARSTVLCVVL